MMTYEVYNVYRNRTTAPMKGERKLRNSVYMYIYVYIGPSIEIV